MYLTQFLHRAVQQNPDGMATIFGDRVRSFGCRLQRPFDTSRQAVRELTVSMSGS